MVASNAGNINPWFLLTEKIKIGKMIIKLYVFQGPSNQFHMEFESEGRNVLMIQAGILLRN